MSYQDKTLTCRDCGQTFTFSAGEQEFYAQRGLTNEPGRCPDCRAASRQRRESRTDNRGGGGGYDRESQPRREMHTTTCANCGKPAQVPFVPRTDRPVYCSDCFKQMRGR
jgi:CxxC-x17-CxxC domain-containing protein